MRLIVPKNMSDRELIDLLKDQQKEKNDSAFRYIYRKAYPGIKYFIIKNGGNDSDALDIFQDSILIFLKQIKAQKFPESAKIITYIYSISKNLWYQSVRKSKRYDLKENIDETEAFELPESDQKGLSKSRTMAMLLNKMDETCRNLLLSYYYENKTMKDIMLYFGLGSEQAAKNKKFRCMKKLSELIESHNITLDNFTIKND